MIVRNLDHDDIPKLKDIWKRHYKDDFDFPRFMKFVCKFVIEDEKGIITAGGIKLLAESILLTDLSRNKFTRFKALNQALTLSKSFVDESDLDHLHAFIQDPMFREHLIRHGFKFSRGDALIYWPDIPD